MITNRYFRHTQLILLLLLCSPIAMAEGTADAQSKTVIGLRNPDLTSGAEALLAGDIEKGVRLTESGLALAQGQRERRTGLQNLCAGYVLLKHYNKALETCNMAVSENENSWRAYNNRAMLFVRLKRYADAEADLAKGQSLAPNSTKLKEVRGILLDETRPVTPHIVIDDRRSAADDDED